jgi:hypothetical protein
MCEPAHKRNFLTFLDQPYCPLKSKEKALGSKKSYEKESKLFWTKNGVVHSIMRLPNKKNTLVKYFSIL